MREVVEQVPPVTTQHVHQPEPIRRQVPETFMETQMVPQVKTVMREQRTTQMQQTMETQMVPQPKTVMVEQRSTTMVQTMEPVTQSVPRTTMKPVTQMVTKQVPQQVMTTVE